MFIIDTQAPNLSKRLKAQFNILEKTFGDVPAHFRMLATLNPAEAERTLDYVFSLMQHPNIDADLFPFLRLFVAKRENYRYCIEFNGKLLKSRGYSDEDIDQVGRDIAAVPFDNKLKTLAEEGIRAVYNPDDFRGQDLQELYQLGWTDADIFDVINHAAFLLKNGRIISAYMNQNS